jgi:hypothetical protein
VRLGEQKRRMLAKYEEAVLGDSKAGRPGPGDAGATLLLSADEHNLVACAMFDFAVELITDAAANHASDHGSEAGSSTVARSGSGASASVSASAQGQVEGAAAAERAYHENLKYGVETKDMITGQFKDAAAGDDDPLQRTSSSRCPCFLVGLGVASQTRRSAGELSSTATISSCGLCIVFLSSSVSVAQRCSVAAAIGRCPCSITMLLPCSCCDSSRVSRRLDLLLACTFLPHPLTELSLLPII